jgi:hypothetical protein
MQENEDSLSALLEKSCKAFLENYIETGNPIWAWEALSIWLLPMRASLDSFPIPEVLIGFLAENCAGINTLWNGWKPLEYRDGLPVEPDDQREITPSEACDFLPEALRLRGYKWNAFNDFRREQKAGALRIRIQEARQDGLSARETMERIEQELGLSDEREVRRKLAGGRGPRQKSPYPAPTWPYEIGIGTMHVMPVPDPKKAKAGKKEKKGGAKKP